MSNQRDGFVVDLSDFQERRQSAHIPAGTYQVRAIDSDMAEIKSGENAGAPMLVMTFEVAEGPYAGQILVDRFPLAGKALFRVVNFLRALGLKVEKKSMQIPFKLIMGRTVLVSVDDGEPYKGEVKSEIRGYKPRPQDVKPADAPVGLQAGEPVTIGTQESVGPLGDEVRAQNAALNGESGDFDLGQPDENGELKVPSEITL